MPVLRTIPWDKVNIKVLLIEVEHLGKIFDGKIQDLEEIMTDNGYKFYMNIGINHVYIKKDMKPRFNNIVFQSYL